MALKRHWYHYLMESIGEYVVKLLVVLLIIGIGDNHPVGQHHAPTPTKVISFNSTKLNYSEVAALATWCFLTVDALSIIGLLSPGHHYTLLEAVVTLTLHLGLARGSHYGILAAVFVLVIVVIKNFLWQHMNHHPQAPTNTEHHPVAPEVV
ncbi:hypothetical protein SESBI_05359 [Sesbania bispinosa]|nr:hypothetical protein SESBI_05359 [Sesbania bispinosa]